MIRAQVKLGVLIIDGNESQEQMEGIADPVMPDIREAELELRVPVGGGHVIRLERDLPLVDFIMGPDVEQVSAVGSYSHS